MRQLFMLFHAAAQPDLSVLTAPLRAANSALASWADAVHALPYRAARWCLQLPERIRVLTPRALAWLECKGVTARVKVFAPLLAAGLILPFCIGEVKMGTTNYILVEADGPQIINGTPDFSASYQGLEILDDDSGRDAQLILDAGQEIQVTHDGQTITATTRRETVANLLRRLDAQCSEEEMVVVDLTGSQPALTVTDTYTHDRSIVYSTDYETERVADPLMAKGTEEVVTAGQNGALTKTYRDTYQQGELVSTELVSTAVDEPVTEVVEYGTLVDEVSRDDRIQSVHYNDDGSGYLLFRSGATMSFSGRVTCEATAYSIGNWTASGRPTKVGNIAVDPSVFPYGTRFYIYTNDGYLVYGNAVAADCGTAIKGHKIDLWFESYDEACWFGRRDCTVFVLN